MSNNIFLAQFYNIPPITRAMSVSIILIMLGVYIKAISPYSLMYVPAFMSKGEIWRIITCFLFFGKPSLDVIVHITFLYRYSSMLEEGFSNTSDYFYLIVVIASMLFLIANFLTLPVLASAFSATITYIWTRKNPHAIVQIFGFVSFPAFYLPFIVPLFMLITERKILAEDFLGIIVGHMYYFLKDVYPRWGADVLRTPCFIKKLFGEHPSNCCKGGMKPSKTVNKDKTEIIDARPDVSNITVNNTEIPDNLDDINTSAVDKTYDVINDSNLKTFVSDRSFSQNENNSAIIEKPTDKSFSNIENNTIILEDENTLRSNVSHSNLVEEVSGMATVNSDVDSVETKDNSKAESKKKENEEHSEVEGWSDSWMSSDEEVSKDEV